MKELNMAKIKRFVVMLVTLTAFGILIAGCDNPTGGGDDDEGLDSALVAKWYLYPTQVDDPDEEPYFEITDSGRLISDANTNGEINVTTSGGIISAAVTLSGQTVEGGTANYTVAGNKLQLSNPRYNGATGGLFESFVSAAQLAQIAGAILGADGNYHKSDPSNPFVGTWTGEDSTLTMTAATWEIDGPVKAKGVYTRDGNTATLTQTHEWLSLSNGMWLPITGTRPISTAVISGNTMTRTSGSTTVTFTKTSGGT
jgi:hypothetical protein